MKKAIIGVLFFVSIFAISTAINAQAIKEQNKYNLAVVAPGEQVGEQQSQSSSSDDTDATKDQNRIKNCENIETIIDSKQKNSSVKQERHRKTYTNVLEKLNDLVDKYKEEGLYTTDLEAKIAILEQKIQGFNSDCENYRSRIELSGDAACGSSENTFRYRLEQSRSSIEDIGGQD